jgi:hypothetical protein
MVVQGNVERLEIDAAAAAVVCTESKPVFVDPFGTGTPLYAYLGETCRTADTQQIVGGRVFARAVTAWDGTTATWGAEIATVFRSAAGFPWRPGIYRHPIGYGVVVVVGDTDGVVYSLWVQDLAAANVLIDRSMLVLQTVIFEGRHGSGLPRGRVFSEHPVPVATTRGWFVRPGGQLVGDFATAVLADTATAAVGFSTRDADGTIWQGAIRRYYPAVDHGGLADFNGDTLIDTDDWFSTTAGLLPASMYEVLS